LNFPDKNPLNINIIVLHEYQIGQAAILSKSKLIDESLLIDKYYQSYVDLMGSSL